MICWSNTVLKMWTSSSFPLRNGVMISQSKPFAIEKELYLSYKLRIYIVYNRTLSTDPLSLTKYLHIYTFKAPSYKSLSFCFLVNKPMPQTRHCLLLLDETYFQAQTMWLKVSMNRSTLHPQYTWKGCFQAHPTPLTWAKLGDVAARLLCGRSLWLFSKTLSSA